MRKGVDSWECETKNVAKTNMLKYDKGKTLQVFLDCKKAIQLEKADYFCTRTCITVLAAIPSGQVQQDYI